jgi:molybdopterin-synthase adenylyltransferase
MRNGPRSSRYARQLSIIGEEGQERLKAARILIAGAGGLGSGAALYLAAAGVGHLDIMDYDSVSESDLNRQILYGEASLGRFKAREAEKRLRQIDSKISVCPLVIAITAENALGLMKDVDVVLDCLDNWKSRHILHRAAWACGVPVVHAAVYGMNGHITTIHSPDTPCLDCLFPHSDEENPPPVLGPICGLMGSLQALEAIRLLTGKPSVSSGRLVLVDTSSFEFENVDVSPNPDCHCRKGLGR